MKNSVFRILFIAIFFISPACSSDNDQRDFEREAYSYPSGFTKTDEHGKVIENDPDDWRIAPLYQGLISKVGPSSPNPLSFGSEADLDIFINSAQTTSFISLEYRNVNDEWREIDYRELRSEAGTVNLKIDSYLFSTSGSAESARGLNRVYLFDDNNHIISYGDIMIE